MENFQLFLRQQYFENTVSQYLWFAGIILAGVLFSKLLSRAASFLIFRIIRIKAAGAGLQQLFGLMRKPLRALLMLIFIYVASEQLDLPDAWGLAQVNEFGLRMTIAIIFKIIFSSVIIWSVIRLIDFFALVMKARAIKDENRFNDHLIPFAADIIKVVIVLLGVVVIMGSVFGINVGSLIAGLGIGGLAVALAAKETLENLFGSFAIYIDKPFAIGDLVEVGDITGNVEKIGFRSTRIRTLDKTYVTIPNKKMIDAELNNISLRSSHRASIEILLSVKTSPDQIKSIIADVENFLISGSEVISDGLVKFTGFQQNALKLLIQFMVNDTDWNKYLEVKETVNFAIMESIQRHDASFASPLSLADPK